MHGWLCTPARTDGKAVDAVLRRLSDSKEQRICVDSRFLGFVGAHHGEDMSQEVATTSSCLEALTRRLWTRTGDSQVFAAEKSFHPQACNLLKFSQYPICRGFARGIWGPVDPAPAIGGYPPTCESSESQRYSQGYQAGDPRSSARRRRSTPALGDMKQTHVQA